MLTDTRKSKYAKAVPLDAKDITFTEGFWKDVRDVVFSNTVPQLEHMFKAPEISHVLENFRICAKEVQGDFDGTVFGDGDFYKWMESAIYKAVSCSDEELLERLDEYIDLIGRAQQDDGYISTKQIIGEMNNTGAGRMGDINDFEVYNFGHLMTSAALHFRLTGKKNFVNIASKAADYLDKMYSDAEEKGEVQTAVCPSHYMGLIELYRATEDKRYLMLAKKAVELRDSVKNGMDDNQDRLPLKKHRKIIGHAVRANYLYAGVADLYLEEGDEEYLEVLKSVWNDLLSHKIYVTGGCGALYNGASPYGNFFDHQLIHQAYGYDYQLPNITAYNETCANIGLVMWAYRMFLIDPKAEYFDVIERVMLNTNLASISLDGLKYFYENMLERTKNLGFELVWPLHRTNYITSYCCPPNLARNLAQSSEYLFSISGNKIFTGLYAAARAHIVLDSGLDAVLTTKTKYPYDGNVCFSFEDLKQSGEAELNLRIPGWLKSGRIIVNCKGNRDVRELSYKDACSYHALNIEDPANTTVELIFDLPVKYIAGHDRIEECRSRVCIERGPLVYCMEKEDANGVELKDIYLPENKDNFKTEYEEILSRNILVISGKVYQAKADNNDSSALYREFEKQEFSEINAKFVPYFAWDNREADEEMRLWFPVYFGA
jgi:DUF1680 family protein